MQSMSVQSQYCSPEQFLALAATPASYARFSTDQINAALQAASSLADVYLTEQYNLPLQIWDMQLSKIVAYITYYDLNASIGFNSAASGDRVMHARYEESIEFLLKISRKELHPNYVDSSSATPAAGPLAVSNPPIGFGNINCGRYNNDWNL